jgi:hypothetical protein
MTSLISSLACTHEFKSAPFFINFVTIAFKPLAQALIRTEFPFCLSINGRSGLADDTYLINSIHRVSIFANNQFCGKRTLFICDRCKVSHYLFAKTTAAIFSRHVIVKQLPQLVSIIFY